MSLYSNVATLEEAENCAFRVVLGERFNILFEYSYLKNRFYEFLQQHIDTTIINCDSKPERFLDEVHNSEGLIIFDHIGKCSNLDVIERIEDKILIC